MDVDRELTPQSHVLSYTMCLYSNKYDLSAQEGVGFYTDHRCFAPSTSGSSDLGVCGAFERISGGCRADYIRLEINLHSVYTKTSLYKALKLLRLSWPLMFLHFPRALRAAGRSRS